MKFNRQVMIFTLIIMVIEASFVYSDTITAYKKDAIIKFYGNPADHTYACVNKNCYAIGNSTKSGGEFIAGGYVSRQDAIHSICASGCYIEYMRNGVCHQHTNRMLYYARRTISTSVQGYSLSRYLYGTYGDTGSIYGTFRNCRKTCG